MFYDATGKTKEQVIRELAAMGLCEHDIQIVLKHIEGMNTESRTLNRKEENSND